jgi:8-oxo-dGTP pyrophosphatase MutT (NUDIX family)
MTQATPSAPKPSGTAVLVRDGAGGLEVLLLHRADRAAHGDWVFPGGKVEPGDVVAGDPSSQASTLRAAVRETREEAGLSLEGVALAPIARWITPELRPKRFDTWFFLGALQGGSEVVVCRSEMLEHRWLAPRAALELHHAKEFALAPPQFVTLAWLSEFAKSADAARELPRRELVEFRPRPCKVEGGLCMLYPGDAGYATTDPAAPGSRHRFLIADAGTRYLWSRSSDGNQPERPSFG